MVQEISPSPKAVTEMPSLRWRPWRELAILGLMVMDISWIVPWYRSLTPATYAVSSARAFFILFGILFGIHLVVRIMNFLRLRMDLRRIIIVIAFILSIFVGLKTLLYAAEPVTLGDLVGRPLRAFNDLTGLIPDEFIIVLVVLGTGWRGVALSQGLIEPVTAKQNFQFGFIMFIGYVFLNTLVTGETPGIMPYIFTFAALTALAASRVSVLSTLRGGSGNPFDRRWFLGMALATSIVVGLAALAAYLAGEGVGVAGVIGDFVFGLFAVIIVLIISPVLFLTQQFVDSAGRLGEAAQQLFNVLDQTRDNMLQIGARFFNALERVGFFNLTPYLKPLLLWTIVIGVSLLIIISLSRWLLKERQASAEEHRAMMSSVDLLALLREGLRQRLSDLGEGLSNAIRFRQGQRLLAAAKIRRIYAQLMKLSSEMGTPRPAASTPLEFLQTLTRMLPDQKEELDLITRAYLKVRYGELPETHQEVDEVETAWELVETQGRELIKQKKKGAAVDAPVPRT